MKKDQIEIGGTYLAKVTDKIVPVRIEREHPRGGWDATNMQTQRPVRVKSAQRLRKRFADTDTDATPQGNAEAQHADVVAAASNQPDTDSAKQMSLLDAAAHILSLGTGDPMRCKDIVDLVVQRQLWTPGKGKTPASTLYAAILREVTTKGDDCRFVKTERGKFALKDSQYIREQATKAGGQK